MGWALPTRAINFALAYVFNNETWVKVEPTATNNKSYH